ncbi:glycosyltransferase family 4 protein [Hydrogenobaculum acidophilum]
MKILIDWTDTYISKLNTGIQRVVKNIIRNKHIIEEITSVEVEPVIFVEDIGIEIDYKRESKLKAVAITIRKSLSRYRSIYRSVANIYKKLSKYSPDMLFYILFGKKVKLEQSDIILLADAFWSQTYSKSFFNTIKTLNVVSLIYDIVPITNPETQPEHIVKAFNTVVVDIMANSKLIITTTNSEKNIIETFLKSKNIEKPIYVVPLGVDIKLAKNPVKPSAGIYFDNFYLMVGTIEPRKNHMLVLKAFHKMWEEGESSTLVIVGRIGWKYEEVLNFINTSPFKNKKLFFLEEVKDEELEYLYQHTKALIMASYREGFGLPVIEAMVRGVPVIASDIPVFREIASDYPTYFDPYNQDSLISAIKSSKNLERKPANIKLNTWEDTTRAIANIIKKHFGI